MKNGNEIAATKDDDIVEIPAGTKSVFYPAVSTVLRDESGHTKFPFSYLAHVALLTLAQARRRLCSGFAQACSPLLTLITIFGRLRRSMLNCFNSSRVGPESVPYIKMVKMGPIFENKQSCLTAQLAEACVFSLFNIYPHHYGYRVRHCEKQDDIAAGTEGARHLRPALFVPYYHDTLHLDRRVPQPPRAPRPQLQVPSIFLYGA
jgi:hypothetical protein